MLASAPGVTVTVLAELTDPVEATTVLTKVPALSPAVKTPSAVIVPPPFTTDHVGVTAIVWPFASVTVAEN